MSIKLQISHDEKEIKFFNKDLGILGFTDYTAKVWEEVSIVNWYVDERKIAKKEKTYIYTGANKFGDFKKLHQIVMMLWYGVEEVQYAYQRRFIIEHHNNDAFDCHISNLSFASNDLNLTKAHSFDKDQPKLLQQAGVNFYKDFGTQQYQITIAFTKDYFLSIDGKLVLVDSVHLLYEDNFRIVYTDANRIVDELLENEQINFRLLSYKTYSFKEGGSYIPKNDERVEGIQFMTDENSNSVLVVGKDAGFIFNSTPPDKDLYKKGE